VDEFLNVILLFFLLLISMDVLVFPGLCWKGARKGFRSCFDYQESITVLVIVLPLHLLIAY
jgi:hypothetical protein